MSSVVLDVSRLKRLGGLEEAEHVEIVLLDQSVANELIGLIRAAGEKSLVALSDALEEATK